MVYLHQFWVRQPETGCFFAFQSFPVVVEDGVGLQYTLVHDELVQYHGMKEMIWLVDPDFDVRVPKDVMLEGYMVGIGDRETHQDVDQCLDGGQVGVW